jgi:hypothetical protein
MHKWFRFAAGLSVLTAAVVAASPEAGANDGGGGVSVGGGGVGGRGGGVNSSGAASASAMHAAAGSMSAAADAGARSMSAAADAGARSMSAAAGSLSAAADAGARSMSAAAGSFSAAADAAAKSMSAAASVSDSRGGGVNIGGRDLGKAGTNFALPPTAIAVSGVTREYDSVKDWFDDMAAWFSGRTTTSTFAHAEADGSKSTKQESVVIDSSGRTVSKATASADASGSGSASATATAVNIRKSTHTDQN